MASRMALHSEKAMSCAMALPAGVSRVRWSDRGAPVPLELKSLNHVARPTKRLEESRRFYVEVLGGREIDRPAFSFRGAWITVANVIVHLIENAGAGDPALEVDTRAHHLAFAVADVDAAEEHLRSCGILFRRSQLPGRATRQLFFQDPDGHVIEVGGPY